MKGFRIVQCLIFVLGSKKYDCYKMLKGCLTDPSLSFNKYSLTPPTCWLSRGDRTFNLTRSLVLQAIKDFYRVNTKCLTLSAKYFYFLTIFYSNIIFLY